MPASIGVNLRVTGHCRQGGRKYMEDFFSVAYQQTEDERDLEYAFFGIYDGHGGAEAAAFAKERLMESIVRHKNFWSDNDEDVLRAIKLGYIETHYSMWKEQDKWPKTALGLPSTSGTTASVAFIRRGKIYIGHVGDSGIVLGYQEPGSTEWKARPLTMDHKPECAQEMSRIEQCGGKVLSKSGVPRVVWNRPRIGHRGVVLRSTPIDEIPFLAMARSLGDLWSYNSEVDEFVVSPEPDCSVIPIDTSTFRCLVFGTDGLYNMLNAQMAVHIVQQAEKHNEDAALSDAPNKVWLNPSKCLVERALELWSTTKLRADNTSVVTLMLDPPGPPRAEVLRNRKKNYADSGLQIVTRYQNEAPGCEVKKAAPPETAPKSPLRNKSESVHVLKSRERISYDLRIAPPSVGGASCFGDASKDAELKSLSFKSVQTSTREEIRRSQEVAAKEKSINCRNSDFESFATTNYVSVQQKCEENSLSSTSSDVPPPSSENCRTCCYGKKGSAPNAPRLQRYEENIQIHEISSSSSDVDESPPNKEEKTDGKRWLRRRRSPPPPPPAQTTVKRKKTSPPISKRASRSETKRLAKQPQKRAPSRRIRDLKSKAEAMAAPPVQQKPKAKTKKQKSVVQTIAKRGRRVKSKEVGGRKTFKVGRYLQLRRRRNK